MLPASDAGARRRSRRRRAPARTRRGTSARTSPRARDRARRERSFPARFPEVSRPSPSGGEYYPSEAAPQISTQAPPRGGRYSTPAGRAGYNRRLSRATCNYGKSWIRRPRRHGRPDDQSAAGQGPHGHRLQPHQVRSSSGLSTMGMKWASTPRAVCRSRRHRLRHGHRLRSARRRSQGPDGLLAGLGAGKIAHRHEHGRAQRPAARWPRKCGRRAPTWWTRRSRAASRRSNRAS